ncbi:MAG: D-hexose-6-phosphate mutarotase, partial [Chloroflexia bacterium]|nr:D-hexose-6-phosphate mutarotase [Chloroflexia bacterium]
DETTLALWPYAFRLTLTVTVGKHLEVALKITNLDAEAFVWSGALHSYFQVTDVTQCRIIGLEGVAYVDKLTQATGTQHGPVSIEQEIDRVYQGTTATCLLEDPVQGHTIRIAKQGSHSTVIWNPWHAKAQQIPDFADDASTSMVCIETANALAATMMLAPDESHTMMAIIDRLEKK